MNSDLHISSDVVTREVDTDLLHRELATLRPVVLHPAPNREVPEPFEVLVVKPYALTSR